MDISFNIKVTDIYFLTWIKNIHMKGTVSHIFYLGLSLDLLEKTGNFWPFSESSFSRFNKRKTKTHITNLRHGSLNVIMKYTHRKCQELLWVKKRDIHVQNMFVKKTNVSLCCMAILYSIYRIICISIDRVI